RLPGMRGLVLAPIERAAAMREPAHDEPVAADDLLAVDAEVLAPLRRAARDGEAPGDERARVPGPAGLDRQAREVDFVLLPDDVAKGRGGALLRRHVQHLAVERE